ncbi:MAG: hypothetical protein M1818_005227 [Claussenomyces sp. TS43310]|nr:MAG: hypothetical protein M1818_005227 [Claussenomyces sp. TS43310]
MAPHNLDSFVMVSPNLETPGAGGAGSDSPPSVFSVFSAHTSAPRVWSESVIAAAVRAQHPDMELTVVDAYSCNLIAFAQAGKATASLVGGADELIHQRSYKAPARRLDEGAGRFVDSSPFASYLYEWKGEVFRLYVVETRDGTGSYPAGLFNFLLVPKGKGGEKGEAGNAVDGLIKAVTEWQSSLRNEVLVFDGGRWHKDAELWKAIAKASWDDVILNEGRKKNLIKDVTSFFESEETYKDFGVPWKRGLIFWGPPGNGKTISIKALMNGLTRRTSPTISLLYVKTLTSMGGDEFSVRQIFTQARAEAPCLLVFEDIDSLVSDNVRSYFLNEVDGLESNHGIMMVGSTNHLERLDPGIAKRPSRFDRKYLFPIPDRHERILYCRYWHQKLRHNDKVVFPNALCAMIADITDGFSFAYMKEAFIAALLVIVARNTGGDDDDDALLADAPAAEVALDDRSGGGGSDDDEDDDAKASLLWKEIQKQVKNLRDEMDDESAETVKKTLIRNVPLRHAMREER